VHWHALLRLVKAISALMVTVNWLMGVQCVCCDKINYCPLLLSLCIVNLLFTGVWRKFKSWSSFEGTVISVDFSNSWISSRKSSIWSVLPGHICMLQRCFCVVFYRQDAAAEHADMSRPPGQSQNCGLGFGLVTTGTSYNLWHVGCSFVKTLEQNFHRNDLITKFLRWGKTRETL